MDRNRRQREAEAPRRVDKDGMGLRQWEAKEMIRSYKPYWVIDTASARGWSKDSSPHFTKGILRNQEVCPSSRAKTRNPDSW